LNQIHVGADTARQAGWLDTLDGASRHLLEIINSILDLSKVEAGRMELEITPIRLDAVVASVVDLIAHQAQAKHLHVGLDLEPLSIPLMGDPTRLRQALLNYATNAVKFTATGSVTLRTRVIEHTPEGVVVRFEVEDSGIGIPVETIDRLFRDFEQADNSTTRQFGGTGLGLAMTRHWRCGCTKSALSTVSECASSRAASREASRSRYASAARFSPCVASKPSAYWSPHCVTGERRMSSASEAMSLVLLGNPNCGKTALFNLLTGSRQKVANYPGVTVDRKEGQC
jgi:hypothetical protein